MRRRRPLSQPPPEMPTRPAPIALRSSGAPMQPPPKPPPDAPAPALPRPQAKRTAEDSATREANLEMRRAKAAAVREEWIQSQRNTHQASPQASDDVTMPNIGRSGLLVNACLGPSTAGTLLGDAQAAVANQALLRTGTSAAKPGPSQPPPEVPATDVHAVVPILLGPEELGTVRARARGGVHEAARDALNAFCKTVRQCRTSHGMNTWPRIRLQQHWSVLVFLPSLVKRSSRRVTRTDSVDHE